VQISAKSLNPLTRRLACGLFVILLTSSAAVANGGAAKINTLAFFSGLNGSSPLAGLLSGNDGNLYGATSQGGINGPPFAGYGTVFKLTPSGTLTTLFSFNNANGAKPVGGLIQVGEGNLFGTTSLGGAANLGVLYRITTNGSFVVLVSFSGTNGSNPSGRLLAGSDGFLYGTTQFGGSSNQGTVFRATTNGVLNTLFSFSGTNGANPYAGLIQGLDGGLYGTTVNGGESNKGTIFRLTTNGVLNTLVSFRGTNGSLPYGGLVQDEQGFLYGTTAYGGADNLGTVFKVSTNGALSTLYSFIGGIDGANPWASLLRGRDGFFYGTTILAGTAGGNGWGTIFQIKTNGDFTPLTAFTVNSNGISPYGELAQDAVGRLYGTTSSLGIGLKGTVFQFVPAPTFLRSSLQGNNFRLNWSAWPGLSYQVQFKTNLLQAPWFDLAGSVTAATGDMSFNDLITGGIRCYRIKCTSSP
jgi:uncharacterized repeat protein (TIGR03803 family)